MSELQNDEYVEEVTEDIQDENLQVDEGAELAPDSETEHEQNSEVDEQDAVQKAINKKHFEAQQAKREAEEYKRKVEEFEAKERERLATNIQSIPDRPDPFDDDYEAKFEAYTQAVKSNAEWEAANNFQQQQLAYNQQQEQIKQQQVITEKLNSYSEKAKELNISNEQLQTAANMIGAYNPPQDLQMAILSDEAGPLITTYLAANPLETEALINAVAINPILAGQKFAEIKASASNLKPKPSKAPAPPTKLKGGMVDPEASYFASIKGAKII